MLYEKLNNEMQEMVDQFATQIRDLSWQRRSDLLAEAALPFAERFGGEQARLASTGFLTAVLERLDDDAVHDPHQACLFAISLNPTHRTLADAYLMDHPDIRQMIDQELDGEG